MSDAPPRRLKICRHCGEPESAHHEFAPQMPAGCQCDPGEWGDYVLDVCPRFEGAPGTPCSVCEHDEACHREQGEQDE
jgi:hypothetical protein